MAVVMWPGKGGQRGGGGGMGEREGKREREHNREERERAEEREISRDRRGEKERGGREGQRGKVRRERNIYETYTYEERYVLRVKIDAPQGSVAEGRVFAGVGWWRRDGESSFCFVLLAL